MLNESQLRFIMQINPGLLPSMGQELGQYFANGAICNNYERQTFMKSRLGLAGGKCEVLIMFKSINLFDIL